MKDELDIVCIWYDCHYKRQTVVIVLLLFIYTSIIVIVIIISLSCYSLAFASLNVMFVKLFFWTFFLSMAKKKPELFHPELARLMSWQQDKIYIFTPEYHHNDERFLLNIIFLLLRKGSKEESTWHEMSHWHQKTF